MQSCVVIGGTGFLGRHLVEDLISRGYRVRVVDIRKGDPIDKVETVVQSVEDVQVSFWNMILIVFKGLIECFGGFDLVFHCASPPFHLDDR